MIIKYDIVLHKIFSEQEEVMRIAYIKNWCALKMKESRHQESGLFYCGTI
jgi:hypothetical protein